MMSSGGDGGKIRISDLKYGDSNNRKKTVVLNKDKVRVLFNIFFHPPPELPSMPLDFDYLVPMDVIQDITEEQVLSPGHHILMG